VFTAYLLLASLIVAAPALALFGGAVLQHLASALAACALGAAALGLRPGEAAHWGKTIRPVAVTLALPALWILIQALPMPLGAFAHPIWASAAEALNRRLIGHISIDPGATVVALGRYLSLGALLMAFAAVAIDRRRAEWILFLIAGACAAGAVILIIHDIAGSSFIGAESGATPRSALNALAALGVVGAGGAIDRAVERYETRRARAQMTRARFLQALAACALASAACSFALLYAAPRPIGVAGALGLATLGIVIIIRRLALRRWTAGALFAGVVLIGAAVAAGQTGPSTNVTLRFTAGEPPPTVSISERMMMDTVAGTGAGTYPALYPIYAGIDDPAFAATAPTFAAQIAVELGWPVLGLVVVLALAAIGSLLRGALSRGRDSFHPAVAAGGLVTLTVAAFCDASLLTTSVLVIATAVLGLGIAQSVGRTAQ
jgi:hypothetical protein